MDFAGVQLIGGAARFSIDMGNGAFHLSAGANLNDGSVHTVSISQTGRQLSIQVCKGKEGNNLNFKKLPRLAAKACIFMAGAVSTGGLGPRCVWRIRWAERYAPANQRLVCGQLRPALWVS
jgi:hypothetical protein